jgi:hypothetical protein
MQRLTAILLEAVVFLSAACSDGHLTRSRAKAQLDALSKKANSDNSGPHPLSFLIGTVSGACSDSLALKDYDTIESGAEYPMLADTGYLRIKLLKNHVWRVELTELGKKSIAGEPYAHKQSGDDCDQWQVSMPLSNFDHLDVTGVLEEGVHAKVDVSFTFAITPAGMAIRQVADKYVFANDKKQFGDKLAHDFLPDNLKRLLGDELVYAPPSQNTFVMRGSVTFNKYDDGWKVDGRTAKEEK